ncbi:GerW family sporulation protein [Desulfoscipio geothermicus]|uniref:Sporulation protein YtfJ n=1 Tax=Desulfoscipio geothermicus DSM 3669 TaxID=1121426 RepID=A0A1I6CTI6_9FIRM|nr:GerW family sporulation protein [Desulfoscipio geothermicus]SFQ96538.1 sporulation protein YtfJ [Desulfoscipio geothermicus DSM 3669]
MEQHPIEGLMKTAMESIKEMVDVNTVVGEPVETPDGSVIIPISRVACGFGAGGGEFEISEAGGGKDQQGGESQVPAFGGGSGAGMSVKPVGFLVAGNGQVRLLPVDGNALLDRLIDMAPQVLNQIQGMLEKRGEKKINKNELT